MKNCAQGPAPLTALHAMCGMPLTQAPAFGDLEFPEDLSSARKRQLRFLEEDYLTSFLFDDTRTSRKRRRVEQKKSVRFSDPNFATTIPRTVCQEDLQDVWYTRSDYKGFRSDSQSLTLAFELGILNRIHPDEFCLRGLEASLSSAHLEARMVARGTMIEYVLRMQQAQKGNGIKDPEVIRGLSVVLSKDACEDALKLAAYDREEAEAVMAER